MTNNPLVALAYVLGIVLGLPVLGLVIRATAYITRATSKLETVAESQARIESEFRDFRHDQRDIAQAVELALALMQADINTLQTHAHLPVRAYPARPDRRQS